LIRKKSNHEEEGNSERWLVSYADFITLLFAFFTTLYAISTVDAQKMGRMVTSTRAAFENGIFNPGSRTPSLGSGVGGLDPASGVFPNHMKKGGSDSREKILTDLAILKNPKQSIVSGKDGMGQLKNSVEARLPEDVFKGRVRTYLDSRGLIVSLGENGLFDSGSDQIKTEGKVLLDTLAMSLAPLGNQIRIEGHTDNVPIHNSRFSSNWELSTARATAVISHLVADLGMHPELISAAGYAEFRPCASNDTAEGKARNRRVDIIILNPEAAGMEAKLACKTSH
jgi:chemotaxis protein MotB